MIDFDKIIKEAAELGTDRGTLEAAILIAAMASYIKILDQREKVKGTAVATRAELDSFIRLIDRYMNV